ncbi:N-acetylmuramic acid 6-phosphate etherase [Roseobacter sp. EG26]|uniref:N-acetylmuramic acid 6-phosphate etherase n=1 Tax=Roseobacter sp. EG26 TaxID=3412477 RepID=UPI003CE4C675
MLLPTTECLPDHEVVDALPALKAADALLDGQVAALSAVRAATPDILRAAEAMAEAVRSDKRITYAAAGSSGLMALADACELPGTFGVSTKSVNIHMAGGIPADGHMPGHTEDDDGAADVIAETLLDGDVVIVLSASGTTPYALAVAEAARHKGAKVIAIANNQGSKLLDLAHIPICLATPPEVIAGSTRLGAGTAQKVALNMMSSLMGIRLGHVYQGQMVNVVADNAKLENRSASMVMNIANVNREAAQSALKAVQGNTKLAILIAAGCSPEKAEDMLNAHDGHLAECMNILNSNQDKTVKKGENHD